MVKNLKLLRESHGLSQQKLADAVGISQQSINKYENHQTQPDILTLIQIADFFHTSVDFLIGHSDSACAGVILTNLSDDEIRLIHSYRNLTLSERESIRLVIENYSK